MKAKAASQAQASTSAASHAASS